jgi:hypothetical protein
MDGCLEMPVGRGVAITEVRALASWNRDSELCRCGLFLADVNRISCPHREILSHAGPGRPPPVLPPSLRHSASFILFVCVFFCGFVVARELPVAFVVSVAYVDPGNFATNIMAGYIFPLTRCAGKCCAKLPLLSFRASPFCMTKSCRTV